MQAHDRVIWLHQKGCSAASQPCMVALWASSLLDQHVFDWLWFILIAEDSQQYLNDLSRHLAQLVVLFMLDHNRPIMFSPNRSKSNNYYFSRMLSLHIHFHTRYTAWHLSDTLSSLITSFRLLEGDKHKLCTENLQVKQNGSTCWITSKAKQNGGLQRFAWQIIDMKTYFDNMSHMFIPHILQVTSFCLRHRNPLT